MTDTPIAELKTWLAEPLSRAVADSVNNLRRAEGVRKVCLMPDVHLASEVCIGAVIATDRIVYPQAVGGDIGCGMAALRIDIEADALNNERAAGAVLAGLYQRVPSNKHRQVMSLPMALRPAELSDPTLAKLATRDGAVQLGTLGRGNHFLEFQADEAGQLWIMLHSGSRAIGQAITAHHLSNGEPSGGGLRGLDAETDAGTAYLLDMAWARKYAAENRLVMLRTVEELVSSLLSVEADWSSLIHADHNHVQSEMHDEQSYFVHRKGAQSAGDGQAGIVPGSMGTESFHTVGRGCEAALTSCSHGAGRRRSRTEARREISTKSFQRQVGKLWYDHRRVNHLRDEAPRAYKDIREVMRAQRELVKIVRELTPVLSYKGV